MFYGEGPKATYITEIMGGGCAFFDYDNDGWMDIYILGGRRLEAVPPGASNRLYHNNRDGTFTDVTEKAGLLDAGWAVGVCVGDYNNDGFEDLYVTYFGQNRLYRNNGNCTFTDVTAQVGLATTATRFGSGCTFVDYNRDGWLDLFVSNYADVDLATLPTPSLQRPNCNFEGVPVNCGPSGLPLPTHALYRNNGDGTFTDVSKESGVAALRGSYGLTACAFDADEDGWPDIFVACDTTPSLLLMNNHDGTFREEALLRGLALSDNGREMAGMGVGVGDYDCDGLLDIVRTHYMNQATGLYHNIGKGNLKTSPSAPVSSTSAALSAGAPASSIWTTTATPTFCWSPARSIPNSSRSSPSIRAAARALSSATRATGLSPSSMTRPSRLSLRVTSAAAAPSATSITTATSTS